MSVTELQHILVLDAAAVMISFHHNIFAVFFKGFLKKRFVQRCGRIVLDFNFSREEKVSARQLYLENLLSLKTQGPNLH